MRWLKRLGILIVFLIAVAGIFTFFTVRNSFPQLNGELAVASLDGPVTVYRDEYGIPQIYADTAADLFRAQGFVEAQDRFYQMDFWRHIGSARLSEMFGDSQLETDQFLRALGLADLAAIELDRMPTQTREVLEWYSEGVNDYLATHRGSGLSLEYALLPLQAPGYEPEPWTPIHTLTWAKMMSWDLSGNFRSEIARTILADTLTPEQVDQLYPPFPADHPVIVPSGISSVQDVGSEPVSEDVIEVMRNVDRSTRLVDSVIGGGFEGIGSNNWVVDGSLTASGMPLLANDPHLSIQMPSIWYEVGLHCRRATAGCPYEVAGFSFPGTPGVVIGHNARIAWGVTTEAADTQDLFIEKINPADPTQYEVDGGWRDMEVRTEVIDVAGESPVSYEVRVTRHGPIISGLFEAADAMEDTDAGYPEGFAVSLAWQSLRPSTLVDSILQIDVASNWDEFRQAASLWDIAAQNLIYADVEGNIGYQSTGEIPVRNGSDGLRPVAGWDSDNDWSGTIPFDEMPFAFNPERGFIETANQPVLVRGEQPFIGIEGAYGYRAARIEELIAANAPHTVESFRLMQLDSRDGGALAVVPALLDVSSNSSEVVEMQSLLERWSLGLEAFQARSDSAGAAAYEATWRNLLLIAFQDDLPSDYWPEGGSRWFEVVRSLLQHPDDPLWDDSTTATTENAADVLEQALLAAHNELSDLLGANSDDWRWGDLHTATFENQTLGQSGIGPIEWLFNRSAPHDVDGGPSLINATGWTVTEGYFVDWVPSMRMIVDLGDLANSWAMHTTGQSGHAFHGNYADMIEPWTAGNQHPMPWGEPMVADAARNTLMLVPIGGSGR